MYDRKLCRTYRVDFFFFFIFRHGLSLHSCTNLAVGALFRQSPENILSDLSTAYISSLILEKKGHVIFLLIWGTACNHWAKSGKYGRYSTNSKPAWYIEAMVMQDVWLGALSSAFLFKSVLQFSNQSYVIGPCNDLPLLQIIIPEHKQWPCQQTAGILIFVEEKNHDVFALYFSLWSRDRSGALMTRP